MKTTIELPDTLLRQAKSAAALRGESLRELVERALEGHLATLGSGSGHEAWRSVFGQASRDATEAVDAVVAEELEQIDLASWR